jgi:hypothetical protein
MLLYDAGEASNAGALAAIMRAVADVPAPLVPTRRRHARESGGRPARRNAHIWIPNSGK